MKVEMIFTDAHGHVQHFKDVTGFGIKDNVFCLAFNGAQSYADCTQIDARLWRGVFKVQEQNDATWLPVLPDGDIIACQR